MELPEWLRSFLDSIVPYAPVAQVVAYTTLTFTSLIVAMVSLRFSFRQNFGWKPILIVATHGLQGKPAKSGKESIFLTSATLVFEVWNRHTYPIVLDGIDVTFDQDFIDHNAHSTTDEQRWYIAPKGRCMYLDRVVVKNGEHHQFTIDAPMKKGQSLDAIDGPAFLKISYYDPRRNRRRQIKIKYRFHFKSKDQLKPPVYKWIRQLVTRGYNGDTSMRGDPLSSEKDE